MIGDNLVHDNDDHDDEEDDDDNDEDEDDDDVMIRVCDSSSRIVPLRVCTQRHLSLLLCRRPHRSLLKAKSQMQKEKRNKQMTGETLDVSSRMVPKWCWIYRST